MRARTLRPILAAAAVVFALHLAAGGDCLEIRGAHDTAYVVSMDDGHTMCGALGDFRLGEKDADAVWFMLDGQTWVVRDPAVVSQAKRLFSEVHAIGEEQGRLGAEQGRLGAKQGLLGAEQGKLAAKQATAALRGDDSSEDYAERMREIGDRMGELGREQGALGEQQGALGAKMARVIEDAQESLSGLLERAMKNGTAVPVKRL